jgi:hypothetical protein
MPTTWDEHGNVVTAPATNNPGLPFHPEAGAKQSWDENGNPIISPQQAATSQSQGLAPTGKAPVGVQMKQSLLAPAGGTFNPLAASDPDNPITKFLSLPQVQAAMNMIGPTSGATATTETAVNLINKLPSAKIASASKAFQELENAIGEHPVAMTDELKTALDNLKEFTDVTGRNPPSVVNKLVSRFADIEQGKLTYKEARMAYSDLSDLSATDKMATNAKMNRLLIPVKQALGDSIQNTLNAVGGLQKYQTAMGNFASAKGMTEFGEKLFKALKIAGVSAGAAGGVYAGYKELTK